VKIYVFTQPLRRSTKSISSFVAGFKSVFTMRINQLRNTPKMPFWQPRFHDRIIRDEIELYNVRNYILKNPIIWKEDDFYQDRA
jgi:putative transposase